MSHRTSQFTRLTRGRPGLRLAALLGVVMGCAAPVDAGLLSFSNPYNGAAANAYYDSTDSDFSTTPFEVWQNNAVVNSPISLGGAYHGQPDYPSISASGLADLETDYDTFVDSQSGADASIASISTYGTDAYAIAFSQSDSFFTVTSELTATLRLEAFASSSALSTEYSYSSGAADFYEAGTDNGYTIRASAFNGTSAAQSEEYTVTLHPGTYLILTIASAQGTAITAEGDTMANTASGHAYLYDIHPAEVPEPCSLSLLSVGCATLLGWRRRRSRL